MATGSEIDLSNILLFINFIFIEILVSSYKNYVKTCDTLANQQSYYENVSQQKATNNKNLVQLYGNA